MKKKMIVISIVMILLVILAVIIFTNRNDPDTTENEQDLPIDIETEEEPIEPTGEDIDLVKAELVIESLEEIWSFDSLDVGEWSIEVPYFNPLSQEAAYVTTELENSTELYINYIDDYASLYSDVVYGDKWTLIIPFNETLNQDENHQLLYDIEAYLTSLNGLVLGRYYDSVTFECLEGETHWIGNMFVENDQFIIEVVRERLLSESAPYEFSPQDFEEPILYLTSYTNGETFQSLHVLKEGGDLYLDVIENTFTGSYWRRYEQYVDFTEILGNEFYINNLPIDEGRIQWIITWNEENPPERVELTLENQGQIPKVVHGEALGALKVSSEFVEKIEATATGNLFLTIDHKEFVLDQNLLDKTPDGDHIIYVPSGLWNVAIYPSGNALVEKYETMMVPVNSGQVTEVIIPNSVASKLKVRSGFEEKGLAISDVEEANNEVTFRFTLLDYTTKDILPDLLNTTVYEGGTESKIINIQPVDIPPSVVLLLDSSGSMKGQMTQTLEAAEVFIESLPEAAKIQVIDFDSKPTLLSGTDKTTVLANLSKIKVGGATTLYDAILQGISLLEDENRPTLVVFTDGQDANLNDTARGSLASLDEVIETLQETDVPLFTIGFGDSHDSKTLDAFAELTEGKYYAADDQNVLNQVFNVINNKLTNTYDLTYERPTETSKSDTPVVSIVVDTSGSMSSIEEDIGERLTNVKFLLHKFVLGLPEGTQMQLTEFNDHTSIVQTTTTDKTLILRGIGSLEGGGATDIEGSVDATYNTLNTQPSSKKVLMYITDAALGTSQAEERFLNLLNDIAESDISTLWVGMGVDDYEHDFIMAAEITGGDYIVSEDVDLLQNKFDEILQEVIDAPQSELVGLSLNIEKVNQTGEREVYSTSVLKELPLKKIGDVIKLHETIEYRFSDVVSQYDEVTAKKISGGHVSGRDIIISNRMKADAVGQNEAARIHVEEVFIMDKLSGVEPPSGYKFLALDMTIENILEPQEVVVYPDDSAHPSSWVAGGNKGETVIKKIAYLIPNFSSHMYLTYNVNETLPASTATWLMANSLVAPGNYSLTIQPDESLSGVLTFLVPEEVVKQTSLHFYDTNYGHINVPIIGVMKEDMILETLPLEVSDNLSDTFGLAITSYEDLESMPFIEDMDTHSALRVVSGNFTSNMQALIDIDPSESIKMRIKSASGDFYIPVNPGTVMIPGGFIQPRMMAPGAQNRVKWLFQLPKALADYQSELFVDLYDEDKTVSISQGELYSAKSDMRYEQEYFNLVINDLTRIEGFKGYDGAYIIADITIEDIKDGYSTSGVTSQLSIVRSAYFDTEEGAVVTENVSKGLANFATSSNSGEFIRFPHYYTDNLLLGLDDETIVYDGTSRRGFVVFDIPDETETFEWHFYSPMLGDMMPVEHGSLDDNLFTESIVYERDTYFEEQFTEAISAAIKNYQLTHPQSTDLALNGQIALDDAVLSKNDVPMPMISLYGYQLKENINTLDELIESFKNIRLIPSNGALSPFENNYSTEAFLMNGFGTEQDFAHAALELLSNMGYTVKPQLLRLTDRGEKLFNTLGQVTSSNVDLIPGLAFQDHKGQKRLLILPFMVFADEVDDIVYIEVSDHVALKSNEMTLTVELIGEYTEKGVLTQLSDITDALSGSEDPDYTVTETMFNQNLSLDMLSLDAIDIGIGVSGQSAKVYVLTANGEVYGDTEINPNHYKFKTIKVTFNLGNGTDYVHVTDYTEGVAVDQIFLTASINAPDISEEASQYLNKHTLETYGQAVDPNELSSLKWYGRNMINQFIAKQTSHDRALARDLDLVTGRTTENRVVVVSNRYNGKTIETIFDLVQSFDEIHKGETEARNSFNIMTGLFASSLESEIIHNGYGLEEIWAELPEGTEMIMLDTYYTEDMVAGLLEMGLDQSTIDHFSEQGFYIIIPEIPAEINSHKRWAWLAINPDNYQTIAVLDNYSKGAIVESVIIDAATNAGKYAVGAFKGVETSVWSVAAVTLQEADYDKVMKKAKAFALGIVKSFDTKAGVIDASVGVKLNASQNVGPIKVSFDGKFGLGQTVLGFNEGFVDGVKLYFEAAK